MGPGRGLGKTEMDREGKLRNACFALAGPKLSRLEQRTHKGPFVRPGQSAWVRYHPAQPVARLRRFPAGSAQTRRKPVRAATEIATTRGGPHALVTRPPLLTP
jgi:hypothetical protein